MIDAWLAALEERHLANLTFAEVARALRALSSNYVERRGRLEHRSAFDSAGKRAAYAVYYSPLHYLTMTEVLRALSLHERPVHHLLDLGCGAGAAGAAWASQSQSPAQVTGVDTHPWSVAEAAFTYRAFGLTAQTRRGDAARVRVPRHCDAVSVGWLLNEVNDTTRAAIRSHLLNARDHGVQVLIIEPIATRVSPWWREWAHALEAVGGRADEWRFGVVLPDLLKRLDHAAGLRHDELTARTLYLPASPSRR